MKDQGGGHVGTILLLTQDLVEVAMLGCHEEVFVITQIDLPFLKDQVDGLVEYASDLRVCKCGPLGPTSSQANKRGALLRRFSTRTRALF